MLPNPTVCCARRPTDSSACSAKRLGDKVRTLSSEEGHGWEQQQENAVSAFVIT
jgi:hypothetical protein